ncbi:MAG TPA: TIGR01777 family oxidoreductase [Chitinophagaceae bacterium]|nr:TIGR01777 family oxidoreductase [Chitinophagaceae bacterium]
MESVTITGGTGLLGRELCRWLLTAGYRVNVLSRGNTNPSFAENIRLFRWNPQQGTIDEKAISDTDFIIHLAGASIAAKRWSESRKKEILESRAGGAKLLNAAMQRIPNRVRAVIGASAIGFYGSSDQKIFHENDPAAPDFLGQTCMAWEDSLRPAEALGKRMVILRLGILLSSRGGALKALSQPMQLGLACIPGSGRQWMSWLHIQDAARIFVHSLETTEMTGIYNAAAPMPVQYAELVKTLAFTRHRSGSLLLRLPPWLLKLALGEMGTELLKSCRVAVDKLSGTGFQYQYPDLEQALNHLE